jgi:hypothetical protein
LYGVLDEESEAGSSEVKEIEKADDNSDEEEGRSDGEFAELLEAVESKESVDAKAREQSASAIKKVCYEKKMVLIYFQIRTICTKICGSPQRRSSFQCIAKRVCGGKKAPEELDPLQKHHDVGMLVMLSHAGTPSRLNPMNPCFVVH